MTNVDTREISRNSFFMMAEVCAMDETTPYRLRVRNLSAGGMMAEGDVRVTRGSLVSVDLRNLGWVEGSVAWKQDNRFGIAFVEEIDPAVVRGPAQAPAQTFDPPRYTRVAQSAVPGQQVDPSRLRKV